MDVADRYVLVSALRDAVVLVPRLDGFLVPRVAPSGENAGVAARRPGSRAPVDEAVLAVKERVEDVVFSWCGSVADATGEPVPGVRSVPVRAAWLADRVDQVAGCEWVELMREDVVAAVRAVRDVVAPAEPTVLEVGRGGVLVGTGGGGMPGGGVSGADVAGAGGSGGVPGIGGEQRWLPVVEVVEALAALGFGVSLAGVDRWVRGGRVRSVVGADGVVLVPAVDVARLAAKHG